MFLHSRKEKKRILDYNINNRLQHHQSNIKNKNESQKAFIQKNQTNQANRRPNKALFKSSIGGKYALEIAPVVESTNKTDRLSKSSSRIFSRSSYRKSQQMQNDRTKRPTLDLGQTTDVTQNLAPLEDIGSVTNTNSIHDVTADVIIASSTEQTGI